MSLNKLNFISINNVYEFENILLVDNNINGNFILNCDIDFSLIEKNKSILNFKGIFDGNNHIIKNFQIENPNNDYIGIFCKIEDSVIKNLKIEIDGKILGRSYVGLLVGNSINSSIIDCKIEGRLNLISNGKNIGTLVGGGIQTQIKNISINLKNSVIRGTKTIGSMVGMISKSTLENCTIEGKLSIIGDFNQAEDFGGLIGFSSYCTVFNCKVLFSGSIIGKKNISGFVAVDYFSNYKDCIVNIEGNLNSFKNTNLFCSVSIEEKSVFENCKVGNKTTINGVLIDIFNILEYNKIANSNFKLVLIKGLYSNEIVSLSDLKLKIMDNDGIIYNIFDYILTFNQLSNLFIDNFIVTTEEDAAKNILNKFKMKWVKLNDNEKKLFKIIGFDQKNFDSLSFPNLKWNSFLKKERLALLKLGFSKNIWDNKIIQGLQKKLFKFNKDGYIVNFTISLTKMRLKIPSFIREIILIEIKDFFIDTFNNCLPDYKDFNIYYSDDKNLDIVLVFSNEIDENDDVCKLDVNNNDIIEKVSRFVFLEIKYNNWVYINNFFRKNKDKYNKFVRLLFNKLFLVSTNCDFNVEIIDYDDNFEKVRAEVKLTEFNADLIDKQNLNSLSNNEILEILISVLPSDLKSYPTHIILKWKLFEDENKFNKYKSIENGTKYYSACIEEENIGELVEYNNINSTILATILINNLYAETGDVLLIYVDDEIRAKGKVIIENEISWVNNSIFSNGEEEVITFKVYQKCNKLLIDVPNLSFSIKPGSKLGSNSNPVCIKAQGQIPPNVDNYQESNFGTPVKYLNNMVTLFGYVSINFRFAKSNDILGIYVNNELRGLTKVFIDNGIPFVNTTIYSSGIEEELRFVVFDSSCKLLYTVPDIKLKIHPGQIIGSYYFPYKIRAVGKTLTKLEDYLNYRKNKPIVNLKVACAENQTQTDNLNNDVINEETEIDSDSDCEIEDEIPVHKPSFINNYYLLKAKKPVKKINKVTGGKCSSGACAASGSGL